MNLELEILTILRNADGYLLPQSTLVAELRLRDRRETLAEIHAAMASLESRDEITGVSNRDTGAKWKIADAGRARLAEARL